RRRIMLVAQSIELAVGALLLFEVHHGAVSQTVLYSIVFVVAAVVTFQNPARAALLPTLVPPDLFPRAVTVGSPNQAFAFIAGPALGGLVIAAAGVEATYAVYVGLVASSAAALYLVRTPPRVRAAARITLRAIREGLRFVWRRQVVLGC